MREFSLGVTQDLGPVVPAEHLQLLRRIGQYRRVQASEHLYRQGEAANSIYLLQSGSVKSYIVNSAGHEATLRIHLPQSLLGLTALASSPWRDASAVALEPAELFAIRRESFVDLISTNGSFGVHLVRLLVDRMQDFHYRVGELQVQSVEQRIARVLLNICRGDTDASGRADEASVALTHQDIANLVNTRRQTVTGVLGQLEEAGLIARKGRKLRVIDPAGLARLLPEKV